MNEPAYHSLEEYQNRLRKLNEIRDLGVEPYPHRFQTTHTCNEVLDTYLGQEIGTSEDAAEGKSDVVTVSGRLVLFRAMGKNAFGQIKDGGRPLQVMFNRDSTQVIGLPEGEKAIKFIEKKLDLGDLLGVTGHLFRTQKGELTLFVKSLTLLCKTLLPLPDKHHGLHDLELRYRKRWLDLITHQEVRERFCQRSRLIHFLRVELEEAGFLEVETPILQTLYGGAEARPFTTHLNAHDQEMYLRISLEISLKKLLVGGMERIYEIGKVFRNEGIDRTHNPEFTMLELYRIDWDYHDMMAFFEQMIERVTIKLLGTSKVTYSHHGDTPVEVDFKAPWRRMTMEESIEEIAGFDPKTLADADMRRLLEEETEMDPKLIQSATRGLLIAMIFDEMVSHKLMQPTHITDHPIETTPLCKPHRDPKRRDEGIVERFESFVLGRELCNAYSELNDPLLQRELLVKQVEKRDAGDEEAHPLDEEFVEAIAQGMPPTAGLGVGVDRLAMLLTDAASIRDVLYFPIMRPN